MEIEVGDRVTYIDKDTCERIIIIFDHIDRKLNYKEILKIERIGLNGWYTVYEKEELLTEEERELLKAYIKWIKSLNNGEIINLYKQASWIVIDLKTQLDYSMEIGARFKKLEDHKTYTLSELRIGVEMEIEEILKKIIKEKIEEEIQNKIDTETEKFHKELTYRKDKYISEIMSGIRIMHERRQQEFGMNYRIIFENIVRLEK